MNKNHIIDLHIHSVHSDGSYTTQELINRMQDRGVTIASFSDHDSVGCYKDLINGDAALHPELTIVPGVEITCRYDGCLRDILGYGIDYKIVDAWLAERFSFEKRLAKQKWIVEQMKDIARKHNLVFDESVTATEGKKAEGFLVMQTELAKYESNIARYPFINQATVYYWEYFANPNSEFFVDEACDSPSFAEAIDIIHKAGGKAFVAHPYYYRMSHEDTEKMVCDAIAVGVDGLELKHSTNVGDDVERILALSEKYGLYLSGGSDYHGSMKPSIDLVVGANNMRVHYEEIEPWVNDMRHW